MTATISYTKDLTHPLGRPSAGRTAWAGTSVCTGIDLDGLTLEGSNVDHALARARPTLGVVMTMPFRKDWVALKKVHKIPEGAVKGVNLAPP